MMQPVLYRSSKGPMTGHDITDALRKAGVRPGDLIMVHCDVAAFGKLGDVRSRDEFHQAIYDAFRTAIGARGTLIVPTFTYSFTQGKEFDVRTSKSTVGSFTEFVRLLPDAVRSEDPLFSHAGIGPVASKLLTNMSSHIFGEGSFFERFMKAGGKIINFGKFFDITFLHYIERRFPVSYRYDKVFNGTIVRKDGTRVDRSVTFFVRYRPEEGRNVRYDMTLLGSELERQHLLARVALGDEFILCSTARDCFRVGTSMLRKNQYAFLKMDPDVLTFPAMPFFTGVTKSKNNDQPATLPFSLTCEAGIIRQVYAKETESMLEKAYRKGSLVSTRLGEGSFGQRRVQDLITHLLAALTRPIEKVSVLEIGCADGYVLNELRSKGCRSVKGCEPGPFAREGEKKYHITIVNDFYRSSLFREKFDVIYCYGVIEHLVDPKKFLSDIRQNLKEGGRVFCATPNCEKKLELGDIGLLGHEHWSYFTRQSMSAILEATGYGAIKTAVGANDAVLYGWAEHSSPRKPRIVKTSDRELFYRFAAAVRKALPVFQEHITALSSQGKTLGVYGGGLNLIGVLDRNTEPRFFNTDTAVHGMYYPGFRNAIEHPQNLLKKPVDELWVAAIDYDNEIRSYLTDQLMIPKDCAIVSVKEVLRADGKAADATFSENVGKDMYALLTQLFPICRSITGEGVRKTLRSISDHVPLRVFEVPTGTKVFDWTVPEEWNIRDAYVMNSSGRKVIDFKKNNLHVVGYSIPVRAKVSLAELSDHLYSLPDMPDAIPYVTSYYSKRWGFCLSHRERQLLKEDTYTVVIDSTLSAGSLTYGELIIPGKSSKEVFLSTYVCHPSLANNELSGPVVATYLAQWLLSAPRRYTYRIIFIPETIGSISYLQKNLKSLKRNMIAGFNITCVGDNRAYSYIPTRNGATYTDKVATNVLSLRHPDFKRYTFLDKGSDERQYNAPGVDLPVCCIMRSKFGTYPEYHTSLDNLSVVSPEGLFGAYSVLQECIEAIEADHRYRITCLGEPQLGRRGLYPTVSTKQSAAMVRTMMNTIAYADGTNDLIDISTKVGVPVRELIPIVNQLLDARLLEVVS
jgi:aminopeptidase-like protein/aminoglycoside N3'-acetyltransferase/SAM-dependent methyltransferase